MNKYYVYIYLHPDGTPYYVGKGCGDRWCAKVGHPDNIPPLSRVWFPVKDTTEEWALYCEMEYIDLYGRLDDGTGILENRTDGGENPPKATTESGKKAAISIKKYYEDNPDKRLETNKNISIAKKKKAHITRECMKKQRAGGIALTEEGKQRVIEGARRANEARSRGVLHTETGVTYPSIREAARQTNTSRNTIKNCIKKRLDKWVEV